MGQKIIRGMSCPACGGSLEIDEGTTLLSCPFCSTGLMLKGDAGTARFYVPLHHPREEILKRLEAWFGKLDKAPGLKREAKITEAFPVYVPFWRVEATVVGWVVGDEKKGTGKNQRWVPVERKVNKKFDYTCPACDIGEFGVKWVDLQGDEIRPFDLEEVQKQGMTFGVLSTPTDIVLGCQREFMEEAASSAGVDRPTFTRMYMIRQGCTIVFYPLWIVRYEFKSRVYQVTADGESGALLYGRAPGNNLYRVVCLLLSIMAGNFILTSSFRGSSDDNVGGAFIIAIIIMLIGFWKFRYGGEVKIEQRHQLRQSLAGLLNLSNIPTDLKSVWKKI